MTISAKNAHLFLEHLPQSIVMLDMTSKIIWFNQAMKKAFPLIGLNKPFALVLRVPSVKTALDSVITGDEINRTVTYEQRVPTEMYTKVLIQRISPDDQDGSAFITLMFTDLTEQKRSEKMHADFIANVSHELRTPLAAIIGFVETLLGPAKDDEEAHSRFLGIMLAQGRRMGKLIQSLLSLTRIELHEHMTPTTPVDLGRVLDLVIQSAQTISRENHVSLEKTSTCPSPLYVIGEEDELVQVFQNLIENAIKYTRPNTIIKVYPATTQPPKSGLCGITVEDQGEGIPAHALPRLTERFYRVDDARSREKGGAGLGLSIVQHILKRHRGQLTIESTLGQGSSFTVWLPLGQAENQPQI